MFTALTALLADGYTYTGGDPAPEAGDPVVGWLIIAGAVAVVVLVSWLVSRIGDIDAASDKP